MKIRSIQDWHRVVGKEFPPGIIPVESAGFFARAITGRVALTSFMDAGIRYRTRVQEFNNVTGGTFEETSTYTSARRVRFTRGSGGFITTVHELQAVEVTVTRNPEDGQSASGTPNSTVYSDPIAIDTELDAGIAQITAHAATADWAAMYSDDIPGSAPRSSISKSPGSATVFLSEQQAYVAGIPGSVHPGSYFRLMYDFIERLSTDAIDGPSAEVIEADITENWEGPGDPDDAFGETWHVGEWVRIPLPSIPTVGLEHITEAANIRTWNYASDRIGRKPLIFVQ